MELYRSDRLLAFSDGVFAVAITLLVIDLHLPAIPPDSGEAALLAALWDMVRKLLVFAFTFLIVGMSWLGHHRKFTYIDRVDGWLLWMNLLYLLTICLIPFASSVLAEHGSSRAAFALYAGVMAMTDLVSAAMSAYGLQERFVGERVATRPGLRQDMVLSPLLAGALFLLGGAMALAGFLSLAHWILILIVPSMALFGVRTCKPASAGAP